MLEDDALQSDPLWFKDAIIYELHVKTFYDLDGDGVGDFRGLIEKLDYLQDLGVTALWLLPFYPSPLRDDGYDIADYFNVNPSYGAMRDFRRLLREAHRRGLRVIIELVINHTSDQHPWFQRAKTAPRGSRYRNYYVWSDDPSRYEGTRIIFEDFENSNWTWDPVAGQYYWHRFFTHQPDLNFDSPDVRREVLKALDYWMDLGVDGMRLDAVPYLFERDGTNCENLPETHEYLQELRAHIDQHYENRMLLAEANQWPEDAAAYFGNGNECHMNFHFPLMPRMFMAVQLENNFPILDILDQTPSIPENCQWAVFLRNHDELTLEMVTDEDRDYMYRVYASDPQARVNVGIRRRLAPLMGSRRRIELMNGLLLSLPGTPVLYYGDEIGMGDNIYLGDRNSVRTPMQWSGDRNAGFSRANPQRLYLPPIIDPEYHYEATNVDAQQNNPGSLLWWMKHIIALRKQYRGFGRGDLHVLDPENPKVLAFIRKYEGERLLVVANLSRFAQYTELDLQEYSGMVPVELFGHTDFPPIGELPYLLSLGPHAFYWFELRAPEVEADRGGLPTIDVADRWENVVRTRRRKPLEAALINYMRQRRWFRGKSRKIKSAAIVDSIPLHTEEGHAYLTMVQINYVVDDPETYVLPLAFAVDELADTLETEFAHAVVARLRIRGKGGAVRMGVLHDTFSRPAFARALLQRLERRRTIRGQRGNAFADPKRMIRALLRTEDVDLAPWYTGAEQTNTSVVYGDRLVLKLFRLVEGGENPELEMLGFLGRNGFPHVPRLAGNLSYAAPDGESATLAVVQEFVANQGDAWAYTLDSLGRSFERAVSQALEEPTVPVPQESLLDLAQRELPNLAAEMIGPYLPVVHLLAQRTAAMHRTLASDESDPAFAPEIFTELYQRSLYQSARTRLNQVFKRLRRRGGLAHLPAAGVADAMTAVGWQGDIDSRLRRILKRKIQAVRIRCHGDFHLGQVLYTGKDVVILDFEGEPARSLSERRFKRSPLRDVAGMVRSFHYASVAAIRHGRIRPEDVATLAPWAEVWQRWVSAMFVKAYLEVAGGSSILPDDAEQLRDLLDFYLLDKCIYELGYEMDNRPDWVGIPIRGLASLLDVS